VGGKNAAGAQLPGHPPEKIRVLVVEDDAGVAEAITMALEDDYEVLVASHGQDALAMLERTEVDVVVLDLMMPVMDGREFMGKFRARGATTPVIVASAGADLSRETARIGAQDFLKKPYHLDALVEKITRLTGGEPSGGTDSGGEGGAPPPKGSPDDDGQWTLGISEARVWRWPPGLTPTSSVVLPDTIMSSSSTRTKVSSPMSSSASSPPA
jgi:DNA-binding response OmpR family regulator